MLCWEVEVAPMDECPSRGADFGRVSERPIELVLILLHK